MRFLLTLVLVFSLSSPVHAQTPSEAEPNVEDLLISANSKKALAAREIAQSPNRVAGELARVMAGMDRLFQEQVQERFDAHYKEIEQALQTVGIDPVAQIKGIIVGNYRVLSGRWWNRACRSVVCGTAIIWTRGRPGVF